MTTPNALLISVTLPALSYEPFPLLRKASYGEEGVFRFVEYQEKGYSLTSFPYTKTANELVNLVEPRRQLTRKELDELLGVESDGKENAEKLVGVFEVPDLELSKVISFLNTYGQIGLANYSRRERFHVSYTANGYEMSVEAFCMNIEPKKPRAIIRAKEYYQANPEKFKEHIETISTGSRVPWSWIEEDIRFTRQAIRACAVLTEMKRKGKLSLPLKDSPELRDFLDALDRSPFDSPKTGKASQTHLHSKAWQVEPRKAFLIVEDFLQKINLLLQPVTRSPLQTSENPKNQTFSVESFLIYSMFSSGIVEKFCARNGCEKAFFPERSSKKFCSDTCSASERQKRHRKKKKTSAVSGVKKTQEKGKNGKTKKGSTKNRN